MTIVPWDETDDPIRLVQAIVAGSLRVARAGPDVGALRAAPAGGARPDASWSRPVPTMSALRRVKNPEEVERLRAAAVAADAAMGAVAG